MQKLWTRRYIFRYNNNDYEPFGSVLRQSRGEIERKAFIGKEKDYESSLGDFGVRKYDDFTGRFFQIDPLWEKYYSWTPYHYSANNPVSFLDGTGFVVIAKTKEAQQTIFNLVPESEREYILFGDGGKIDKEKMNSIFNSSPNFKKLRWLVYHPFKFNVIVDNKFNYINKDGILTSQKMDDIPPIDPDWVGSYYTLSTKERGYTGQTLIPGVDSPDNQVYCYINPGLTEQGAAETNSHELLGHAFLFSIGLPYDHNRDSGVEKNILLKYFTIGAMALTRYNFIGK